MEISIQEIFVNIIAGFISTIIMGALTWLRRKYILVFSRDDPRYASFSIIGIGIIWLLTNISMVVLTTFELIHIYLSYFVLFATSGILFVALTTELNQYWMIGLRGADRQIRKGIDYSKSLNLVRNQISFLGTGAAKITDLPQFSNILQDCDPEIPIRFLLLSPSDKNLYNAAKRAGKPEVEYREIVLNSLRKIKFTKERRDLNIEVRFYPETPRYRPIFRLMFIDDSICLLSYNIFGEGDGSQLPQLHIVKAAERNRVSTSFYHPLKLYFDWLWDLSEPWDFNKYIP